MLNYQYLHELTYTELNELAGNGWIFITGHAGKDNIKDCLLMSGSSPINYNNVAEVQTEIIGSPSGNNFVVENTITYGDIILTTLLTLFLVLAITSFLIKFVVAKLVNFKRH